MASLSRIRWRDCCEVACGRRGRSPENRCFLEMMNGCVRTSGFSFLDAWETEGRIDRRVSKLTMENVHQSNALL